MNPIQYTQSDEPSITVWRDPDCKEDNVSGWMKLLSGQARKFMEFFLEDHAPYPALNGMSRSDAHAWAQEELDDPHFAKTSKELLFVPNPYWDVDPEATPTHEVTL